jgi:serralysin
VTDQPGDPVDLDGAVAKPPGTLNIAPSSIAAFDTTNNQAVAVVAEAYTGPVANITQEYINISSDSLNVSVNTPNWFIHNSGGTGAIAVSSGTNVLDGGAGSSFMSGGTGADTFFVNSLPPAADTWSTAANFHAGDAATFWGLTPEGFSLDWADGQGAAGYTGLTLHATAPGQPTASLTLVGYDQADLNNGRLSVLFGTGPAGGRPYMYIAANS